MQNFHHTDICPIRDIISRLSSKWAMLILVTLKTNEMMRFSDIQRSIGDISQRMLTVTLRMLESDGLVSRQVYPEIPPRVEYRLTDRGYSLMPYIDGLIGWAINHLPEMIEERQQNSNFQN